jgi:hypothetical protein
VSDCVVVSNRDWGFWLPEATSKEQKYKSRRKK